MKMSPRSEKIRLKGEDPGVVLHGRLIQGTQKLGAELEIVRAREVVSVVGQRSRDLRFVLMGSPQADVVHRVLARAPIKTSGR